MGFGVMHVLGIRGKGSTPALASVRFSQTQAIITYSTIEMAI